MEEAPFILPEEFQLKTKLKHEYAQGSFEQKYVDHFCNGDKLTNMDEFIAARSHFEAFNTYTKAPTNGHRNSQYMKFWVEEARRCIEGYNIGRDWIPGYLYFYWNYSPIWTVKEISREKGSITSRADRVWKFPDLWDSDYFWFHYLESAEAKGKHAVNLKSRGKGYSFKGSSMLNRNYFLVPGSKSYAVADQLEYLTKDGIFTKAWELMSWINDNTAWTKKAQVKDTDMHKRASYRKTLSSGATIEAGYKSEILGIVLNGNPDKIRGKRGKLMLYEEGGNNPVLTTAWGIAQESMQEDGAVYGLMCPFGTGGSAGHAFAGLENMMNKPSSYNIYGIPDIFHGHPENKKGFFLPVYLNRRGAMDSNGNSDIFKAAVAEEEELRKEIRKSGNSEYYIRKCAERPFTIEEATLRMEGSPFDTYSIRQVLSHLKSRDPEGVPGKFVLTPNGPEFLEDWKLTSISEYPLTNEALNTDGCWIIYEKPHRGTDGTINLLRYIAGNDPIDFGTDEVSSGNQHSLSATYVMDSITGNIVAEYVGRPARSEMYYEELCRGIEWYKASLLYENNLKGLFSYFNTKGKAYLLADEPEILRDRWGYRMNNRGIKGFHATKEVNSWARDLINSWSTEEVIKEQDQETGELIKQVRMWNIKSVGLLQEMEKWNKNGNFDRVSSLGALMLLRESRKKAIEAGITSTKDLFDNKFFSKIGRVTGKTPKRFGSIRN